MMLTFYIVGIKNQNLGFWLNISGYIDCQICFYCQGLDVMWTDICGLPGVLLLHRLT